MAAGGLPAPDIHRLWSRSRGRCAEPDCGVPLIERNGSRWTTVGEVAHIAAQSPGGPRFDASLTTDQIDSYDNTLLLCRRHHRVVDDNPADHPPSVLRDWKAAIEQDAPTSAAEGSSILRAPAQCLGFVPRPQHLERIKEQLTRPGPAPLAVAISGISGSGKSELARSAIDALSLDLEAVWWFDGGDGDVLRTQLGLAGDRLGVEQWQTDDVRSYGARVAALLGSLDQLLVVVDNLASWSDLPTELVGDARLIVTTQTASTPPGIDRIEVAGLENDEVEQLLHLAGDSSGLHVRLAELAQSTPIVLAQFRTILSSSGMSTQRLVDLLEDDRVRVLESLETGGEASFAWSLRQILEGLDPRARAVLTLLGHLAPYAVDETWLSELDMAQGAFGLPVDDVGVEQALIALRERSLVARNRRTIVVHDLVHDFVARDDDAGASAAWAALCTAIVGTSLPVDDRTPDDRERMAALLPHLLHIVDTCPEEQREETVPYLVNRAASFYQTVGLDSEAEVLLGRGLDALDDPHAPMRATLLNNLANIRAARLDLDVAREMHDEAVRIKESDPDIDPVILAISYSALATTYNRINRNSDARRYFEMALPIYEEASDDRRFLDCLTDLSSLDAADGRWLSAYLYAIEGIARGSAGDSDYLAKAHTCAVEALLEHSYGPLAELLLERAAAYAEEAVRLADVNPLDLEEQRMSRAARGRVRSALGDISGAAEDLERALELLLTSPTRSDLGIATARGNLGRALCGAGDVERGLDQLRVSASDIEELVGVGHHSWVIALTLLIENLVPAGLLDEAQNVLKRLDLAGSTGANVDASRRLLDNALAPSGARYSRGHVARTPSPTSGSTIR